MNHYTIFSTNTPPPLDGAGTAGAWAGAEEGRVAAFRPEGGDHRPDTRFRLLHDAANLYVKFEVQDRYVRSVQTNYQDPVCTDSCAEFFVQPRADCGYFNFEVNAGGT